jgi:hypothetical protein
MSVSRSRAEVSQVLSEASNHSLLAKKASVLKRGVSVFTPALCLAEVCSGS